MHSRRTGTIITHVLTSIAVGFVAVAVGLLVSNVMDPVNAFSRAVPVVVGVLVAVSGGVCAAWLVPWLVGGGLRSTLLPGDHSSGGGAAEERRASHQQR